MFLVSLDFVFDALLKSSYCITVCSILCEFIVNLRKLLNLDFVKLDFENSILISKLGSVFCGELNVNVKFFTDVVTYNLLFEAGDELT